MLQVHDHHEVPEVQAQREERHAHDLAGVAHPHSGVRAHHSGVALHRTPGVDQGTHQGLLPR